MTVKTQIILLALLAIGVVVVINIVRREKLQLKYALPWLACAVALAILVAIPRLIDSLAAFLGIQSPVNMVFFLGFLFSLAIIFALTVMISRLTARLRQLTQAVALLEKRLEHQNQAAETNE
jgi:hypothetical protein